MWQRRERRRRAHGPPREFAVGSRVLCRAMNADEFFYPARVVRGVRRRGSAVVEYRVRYDDGAEEDGLLRGSMLRCGRGAAAVRAESGAGIVEDGFVLVGGTFVRRVRLLHFPESRGFYQSALLLSSHEPNAPDFSLLPFEVNQAMLLATTVFRAQTATAPNRLVFLGCGGGAVPSCVKQTHCPHATVVVVDLSEQVLALARKHFFMPTEVECVACEALEFLRSHRARDAGQDDDVLVVDIAHSHDQFLPPAPFLTEESVGLMKSRLTPNGGVLAMNVLPNAANPDHARIAARVFRKVFGAHSVFAIYANPNFVLFGVANPRAPFTALPNWIAEDALMSTAVPGILARLRTSANAGGHALLDGYLCPYSS